MPITLILVLCTIVHSLFILHHLIGPIPAILQTNQNNVIFFFIFCIKKRALICSSTIITNVFVRIDKHIILENDTWASLRLMVSSRKTIEKPFFCYKSSIHQNKTIFFMSFLHNDYIVLMTFYLLIFSMIWTLFNLIWKLFIKLFKVWEAESAVLNLLNLLSVIKEHVSKY